MCERELLTRDIEPNSSTRTTLILKDKHGVNVIGYAIRIGSMSRAPLELFMELDTNDPSLEWLTDPDASNGEIYNHMYVILAGAVVSQKVKRSFITACQLLRSELKKIAWEMRHA
jgi:hypothetical protein